MDGAKRELIKYLLGQMTIEEMSFVIIKPCPRCGGATEDIYCGLDDGYPLYKLSCNYCGSYLICSDDTEMYLKWNAGEHYYPAKRRYYNAGEVVEEQQTKE